MFLSWVGWGCSGSESASKSSKVTQEGVLRVGVPVLSQDVGPSSLLSLAQLTTEEN